jgi:hypothetical protein
LKASHRQVAVEVSFPIQRWPKHLPLQVVVEVSFLTRRHLKLLYRQVVAEVFSLIQRCLILRHRLAVAVEFLGALLFLRHLKLQNSADFQHKILLLKRCVAA